MTSPACFARSTRACASSSAERLANRPSPSRQETDRPAPPDGERGMTIGAAWTRARTRLSPYRAQLRFCLRMTAAALLAFALAQIWNIPLNGLWAVLTAVVVTQMSVGGSLHATTEYVPGAIVLLIAGQVGEGPIESALYRLLEVALGGGVAVVVSLLVLPQRAYGLGLDAAARLLDLLAQLLLKLLAGFTQRLDVAGTTRMQQEAGRALAAFQ